MNEIVNEYERTIQGRLEVEQGDSGNYYFFYDDDNIGGGWKIAVYNVQTEELDILANEKDFDEAVVGLDALIEDVQDYIQGL